MSSKLINICATKAQADYAEQVLLTAKYENVTKEQIEDCTLSEYSGEAVPYTNTPVKYYDDANGELWMVTADVPA